MAKHRNEPNKPVLSRLDFKTSERVEKLAKASNTTPSAIVRASLHCALALLELRPELVRQLDAGLPLPPDAFKSAEGLCVSEAQCADVKQIVEWYGLKAEDVLREALELGLKAVVSLTAIRQMRVAETGQTVTPEEAERWIALDSQAHAYHSALVQSAARERGLRQLLANVAAHPDGAKALEEIHARDEDLRKKGLLTPFGLKLGPPTPAAASPSPKPAKPSKPSGTAKKQPKP